MLIHETSEDATFIIWSRSLNALSAQGGKPNRSKCRTIVRTYWDTTDEYTHTSTPVHTHQYTHTSTHTPVHTHQYTHTSTHTPVHTHQYTHQYTHTSTHTPVHTHQYTHTSTHTPVHTHQYTHTSTHTPVHTHWDTTDECPKDETAVWYLTLKSKGVRLHFFFQETKQSIQYITNCRRFLSFSSSVSLEVPGASSGTPRRLRVRAEKALRLFGSIALRACPTCAACVQCVCAACVQYVCAACVCSVCVQRVCSVCAVCVCMVRWA
jgi:hypothetical protein